MDVSLNGKRAIVCGSTQGIGKASAIELALLGASVTLIARDEEKLRAVMKELPGKGNQKHDFIVADFNDAMVLQEKVSVYAGGYAVHILVNNTGGPPAGAVFDAPLREFTQAFSNHLLCNHILVQAFVPGMKKEKYGRIINVISTSVKTPLKGLGVSNTIRAAVANWAKTLSMEVAPFGITVNNVLPGSIMTGRLESLLQSRAEKTGRTYEQVLQEMIHEIPAGRIGEAKETAAAIAFLATPAAAYINGINIPVDGGRTACL